MARTLQNVVNSFNHLASFCQVTKPHSGAPKLGYIPKSMDGAKCRSLTLPPGFASFNGAISVLSSSAAE